MSKRKKKNKAIATMKRIAGKPSNSKYALKVARRKRMCRELGIPDTPLPLIG